ncbi:MAG: chromosome segregation protein SMC [Balneolaceae bacterium]
MYISELELHGFKSFAHKTHVKFDSGITAIVGPNGCGKSNIVDALRWVLGEQRPSLLRSSAMSNVIFNGTAKKKALGLADVSLTFVNNKGILPTEYSELTITRRLYRSGDSEYLINNTPCRLKDIMELFMDTGMSSDAYSVIELKMVEEILNDRNNDRRRLFEEAAGVTRYKEKRRHTLRKLDETQKDLQRLEDILVEVRKNVASLERQAEKAAKAKAYRIELEQLDKAYNLHEYNVIRSELEPLKERITHAEKEKQETAKKLDQLERAEEQSRTELIEKEREQAEAQRRVSQLHASIRDMETNLRILEEKIRNEESAIDQQGKEIEQSKADLADLRELRTDSRTKLEAFSDDLTASEKSLKASKETFTDLQQGYSKVRHELFELEISVSDTQKKLNQLQSSRIKWESKLENSEDDRLRIDRDIEDLQEEIANARGELAIATKKVEKEAAALEKKEHELETVTAQKETLEEKRELLREEVRSLKSRLDALTSEKELLENLARSTDALPAAAAFLMEKHGGDFSLLQPVGSALQTDQKHAPALEAALGDAINFLIVKSMDDAVRAGELLKASGKGQATFIPLDELTGSYPVAEHSIVNHIKTKKELAPVANLLLGNTVLADDLNTARTMVKGTGRTAVTLDGELYAPQRFLKSGSRKKRAGVRLGLQDKIEAIEKALKETRQMLNKQTADLDKTEAKIRELSPESIRAVMKEVQSSIRELEQQVSRHQSSISVYEKNIGELNNRKQSISSTENQAREELEAMHPQQKELQIKMETLGSEQAQKKKELQKLEEERAIAQNRYNDAQLKHQDVRNKAANIEKELERAESGIQSIESRLASRETMKKESAGRIEEFKEAIAQTKQQLIHTREQKAEADKALALAEEQSAKQRGTINEIDKELKEVRRRKEVNLELVHHLQMAKEKFEMQSQSHSDHIWETYGILMDQLTETLPDDIEPEEARKRIQSLRQKLNSIGEVNPLAIEEFKEEKERLDFYEEQIADLEQAEKELRDTIDEINRTATERFSETFQKIRENFQSVFHTLFQEDDHCDLLIDEEAEDPLEAKIEIKANPRGKRPSSINQLSGGEKTLTAIALLFAIYLVKPSPFCVLDEVDAPLDDANIERFSAMIRRFSDETQFIIITHNKKTMSKAEMMYGVTMPETGVSRLVGVKLDEVAQV